MCPTTDPADIVTCTAEYGPAVYTSDRGEDDCTICPAGYMCPSDDASANARCPFGTYSIAGDGGITFH